MESTGDTPLHSAIRSFEGDENSIKIILENGDNDINVHNSEGETPLLLAVQNKNCSLELIKLLLKHGADVKATSPRDGNTALHWVAMMLNYVRNIELWRMIASDLLENGSDANAKNLEGSIPLHLAAEAKFKGSGHLFMLHLEMKSDVNARNSNGDTPLHLYMRNDKVLRSDKMIFLEIARDVKLLVNVANSKGETPLHFAVRSRYCNLALIRKFLVLGADVSMKDATGENAYQAFCRVNLNEDNKWKEQDIFMSQTILRGNLQQEISSSLHVACLFHNVDSVHKLLRMGADVNAVDPFEDAPLHYASALRTSAEDYENQCSTLRLILDYGADVNRPLISLPFGHVLRNKIPTFLKAVVTCKFIRERPIACPIEGSTYNNSNLFLNMRDISIQHAAKLLALQEKQIEQGSDVQPVQLLNEMNLQMLDMDWVIDGTGYKDWLSRCSEEMQVMCETKIGHSGVSFYDLLVASAKDTAKYAKNKEMLNVFHAKKAMFPMYQGMLDAKLARDLERRKLIESAAVSMCNVLGFADPSHEFYERTLSYCSNRDLMHLVTRKKMVGCGNEVILG